MSAALQTPGVRLDAEALIGLRRYLLKRANAVTVAALPGGVPTRAKGHGLEVADTRVYVPGDDVRHLDRGTTARTGRLHIRQFQQDRDHVMLLVADMRPSMLWGMQRAFHSVVAAEALALLGWNAITGDGRVGLLALTAGEAVVVPIRGRVRGMLDVIRGLVQAHEQALRLAQAGQRAQTSLDVALTQAERLMPSGADLVLASGFDAPDADLFNRLDGLARSYRPHLLAIRDGLTWPKGRYPIRLENGRQLHVRLAGKSADQPALDQRLASYPIWSIEADEPPESWAGPLLRWIGPAL